MGGRGVCTLDARKRCDEDEHCDKKGPCSFGADGGAPGANGGAGHRAKKPAKGCARDGDCADPQGDFGPCAFLGRGTCAKKPASCAREPTDASGSTLTVQQRTPVRVATGTCQKNAIKPCAADADRGAGDACERNAWASVGRERASVRPTSLARATQSALTREGPARPARAPWTTIAAAQGPDCAKPLPVSRGGAEKMQRYRARPTATVSMAIAT